jgi:hypothetical protein
VDIASPKREASRLEGCERYCGAWTLLGTTNTDQGGLGAPKPRRDVITRATRFVRLRCKCWRCSRCGPRKAQRYCALILQAMIRAKLTRFLTLTVDMRKFATPVEQEVYFLHFSERRQDCSPCSCSTCRALQLRSIAHIRLCWNKLRTYMRRRFHASPNFIAVLEFQQKTGMAHLHIVIDRYIEQAWLKHTWQNLGGGQHVDIRQVRANCAAAYLSKYLSKDMLQSAPLGIRRVTTSRQIRLEPVRVSELDWKVVRTTIERLLHIHWSSAFDVIQFEGEIESFHSRK